jgi:Holliday junction DNA helicase RuvA
VIYSLNGKVNKVFTGFAVFNVHGVGFKVFMADNDLKALSFDTELEIFTHLHVKEDALDLYGFLHPKELSFFELLISVSGVGPKSALSILDVAEINKLTAAIVENRPDLLTQASGIGRKTAEKVIIELRGKVATLQSEEIVRSMESDGDLVETLSSLGYKKEAARAVLSKIPATTTGLEARLKEALRLLSGKGK